MVNNIGLVSIVILLHFFKKIGSVEKCRTLAFKPLKIKMKDSKYSLF